MNVSDDKATGVPPGLDSSLKVILAGGDTNWRELARLKLFTNVFICDKKRGRILLGMKKRGFGKGMYNGFGGKVDPNETPPEGAARELEEEAGITAKLKECGILLFVNASTEYSHYVHMYRADTYEGEPIETEEMHPYWFAIPQEYLDGQTPPSTASDTSSILSTKGAPLPPIPLSQMWPDDEHWMPLLLKDQYFVGRVDFGMEDSEAKKGSWTMERWWFGTKA